MSEVMVDRFKTFQEKFGKMTAVELAKAMATNDVKLTEASAAKALLESEKEFLRIRLPEIMKKEEILTLKIDAIDPKTGEPKVRGVRYQDELFVTAPEEGGILGRVVALFKRNGNEHMVKEIVHNGTLKSHIAAVLKKQQTADTVLQEYKDIIDTGVKITTTPMARFF